MFIGVLYLLRDKNKEKIISFVVPVLLYENVLAGIQFFQGFLSLPQNQKSINFYSSIDETGLLLRPTGTFLHSNELAFFSLIYILTILLFARASYLRRKFVMVLLVVSFFTIVISQSRTVWGILLIIGLLSFRRIYRQLKRFVSVKMIIRFGIIGIPLLLFVLFPRLESLGSSWDGGSVGIRQRMIVEGWEVLRQNPWFGYGMATNTKAIANIFPNGYVQDFPYPVHMGYLQLMLESGIPATIFFFLPFVLVLREDIRRHTFLSCCMMMSILVYYIFQPHAGRLEMPFLGFFSALALYDIHPSHE